MLGQSTTEALERRGLDVELIARLGIEDSDKLPGDCIAIPYLLGGQEVNHKYRRIEKFDDGRPNFMQDAGGVKCFWNVDVLDDATLAGQPLIITEGEFDAIAAMQAGFQRVISVPDGAPSEAQGENDAGAKYSYVRDALDQLKEVGEFILAVDADGPGVNLLNDLAIRLGKHRCRWVKYPKGCKDLNDALRLFGAKGVQESIRRAEWMRVTGVYRMSDLPPAPDFKPHKPGMDGLDDRYRVRMCDFAVVTGIPSHGKTAFINDFVCRLVVKYGWTACFGSFEQHPQIDHRRNLRRWYCRAPVSEISAEEAARADEWIDKNFVFIVPDEDADADLVWVLERCAAAVVQYGAKIVVIDPWNELDHLRPSDMSLTEYVGFAIRQLKRFARKYQVHLIVVAHPAKMRKNEDGQYPIPSLYDISDSAHWYNKPDVGVVVHRKSEHETLIRIAKSRYHDIIGQPGDEYYSFNTFQGRFEHIPEEVR